jgi:hypothetical protein
VGMPHPVTDERGIARQSRAVSSGGPEEEFGCRNVRRIFSIPQRRSWRASGKAMPGHWTGGLMWICLSGGRWLAAGGPAPNPEELFAVGLALAAFLRVGWPIGNVCTDIV